ncbi:hypothetical protein ACFQMF_00935 [Halorubrum rutilum]|uniref:DUF8080 domain-containing protein n=1 Tax=Halorubrum rutilum TaxID=1364933 RepID=A0ABD6AFT0_9EURY|nr:hypothetical protein [Halorubrum rutilum]
MELSWTVDRAGDASLVRCRVRNDDAAPRRVRVESEFDAPVLPPRRAGVPADGWDASGVTLRMGPDERRGFGFATPAPPVDPPVEIVAVEPVDASDPDGSGRDVAGPTADGGGVGSTPAAALRELAEHRPPRAAVDANPEVGGRSEDTAAAGDGRGHDGGPGEVGSDDAEGDDGAADGTGDDDAEGDDGAAGDAEDDDEVGDDGALTRTDPDSVDDWFAAVKSRIERAERLAGADVETATEVVGDAGGVDALAELDDRLDDDAERLRSVSERAASLAERAAETDVPVDALERLS